ncbi:MAG: hypothetical protein Q4Q13_07675, partial [Vagococcus sp.]|nr:hypothetical protein [Vagococcus sp.]
MYLAIKEILRQKNRYLLVVLMVTLIAYLVFFLSGLAFGLANSFRSEVDRWQADSIILSESANQSLLASMIPKSQLRDIEAQEMSPINILQASLYINGNESEENTIKVSLLGYERDSFIAPTCISGRLPKADDEVLLSESLRDEKAIEIGDTLVFPRLDLNFKVCGFVKESKFSVSPMVYTSLENATTSDLMISDLKEKNPDAYAMAKAMMPEMVQAVAIRG